MSDKEYQDFVEEAEERLQGHEKGQGLNRKGDD